MANKNRTAKAVLLRVNDRERAMIEWMSQQSGLNLSDTVRQAVREEYSRRCGREKVAA